MENFEAYGLSGILLTIVTGIGWLIKRYFAERDRQREEIKQTIAKLEEKIESQHEEYKAQGIHYENQLDNIQSIIWECDNPDCKAKKALGEFLKNRHQKN